MVLQLNDVEIYKAFPQEGTARITEQMPLLRKEGRVPMSVYGLGKRRVEVFRSSNERLKANWIDNYFYTGDGCARNTNNNIKVVYDAQELRDLTLQTKLLNGAIPLDDSHYGKLEGPEFKVRDLERYTGRDLTEEEVNNNPLWIALFREDKSALKEFSGAMFFEGKKRFGYDEMMGLYLPSVQKQPIMRLWCVRGLFNRSNACGYDDLHYGIGRLVGVAPEAQVVAKDLEAKL